MLPEAAMMDIGRRARMSALFPSAADVVALTSSSQSETGGE
jgi:hypothetical protein